MTVTFLRLAAFTIAALAPSFAQPFDLILRGGRVLDGTGNPWFAADIGIRDGKILRIGGLAAAGAARIVDVKDKYVVPGFIDLHSHSDRDLSEPGRRTNLGMVSQGITTGVVNQDGRPALWPLSTQRIAACCARACGPTLWYLTLRQFVTGL
jgi:N-acyl-D-amino-acid deacylase